MIPDVILYVPLWIPLRWQQVTRISLMPSITEGLCYYLGKLTRYEYFHVLTLPSPLQATQSLMRLVFASILFPEPEHTGHGIVSAGIRRILRATSGNSVYWSRVVI